MVVVSRDRMAVTACVVRGDNVWGVSRIDMVWAVAAEMTRAQPMERKMMERAKGSGAGKTRL